MKKIFYGILSCLFLVLFAPGVVKAYYQDDYSTEIPFANSATGTGTTLGWALGEYFNSQDSTFVYSKVESLGTTNVVVEVGGSGLGQADSQYFQVNPWEDSTGANGMGYILKIYRNVVKITYGVGGNPWYVDCKTFTSGQNGNPDWYAGTGYNKFQMVVENNSVRVFVSVNGANNVVLTDGVSAYCNTAPYAYGTKALYQNASTGYTRIDKLGIYELPGETPTPTPTNAPTSTPTPIPPSPTPTRIPNSELIYRHSVCFTTRADETFNMPGGVPMINRELLGTPSSLFTCDNNATQCDQDYYYYSNGTADANVVGLVKDFSFLQDSTGIGTSISTDIRYAYNENGYDDVIVSKGNYIQGVASTLAMGVGSTLYVEDLFNEYGVPRFLREDHYTLSAANDKLTENSLCITYYNNIQAGGVLENPPEENICGDNTVCTWFMNLLLGIKTLLLPSTTEALTNNPFLASTIVLAKQKEPTAYFFQAFDRSWLADIDSPSGSNAVLDYAFSLPDTGVQGVTRSVDFSLDLRPPSNIQFAIDKFKELMGYFIGLVFIGMIINLVIKNYVGHSFELGLSMKNENEEEGSDTKKYTFDPTYKIDKKPMTPEQLKAWNATADKIRGILR